MRAAACDWRVAAWIRRLCGISCAERPFSANIGTERDF